MQMHHNEERHPNKIDTSYLIHHFQYTKNIIKNKRKKIQET